MATREEVLIGFQIIRKLNVGNYVTHESSDMLVGNRPHEDGPIMLAVESEEPDAGVILRALEYQDVVQFVGTRCAAIDKAIGLHLDKFLAGFHDTKGVRNGLQHFRIPEDAVRKNKDELLYHNPNVKNVIELVPDLPAMKPHGELLRLYEEKVPFTVQPSRDIPIAQQRITTVQNVLNAIAFELQGICNFTGEKIYPTPESRKEITVERLKVVQRGLLLCHTTPETKNLNKVFQYVEKNLPDAATLDDLAALGQYINTHVTQLPILWRWWNYG